MTPAERVALPRYQRQVRAVHAGGARVVAELLAEMADRTGGADVLDGLLEQYAALCPEALHLAGAGNFPPSPIRVVA